MLRLVGLSHYMLNMIHADKEWRAANKQGSGKFLLQYGILLAQALVETQTE